MCGAISTSHVGNLLTQLSKIVGVTSQICQHVGVVGALEGDKSITNPSVKGWVI